MADVASSKMRSLLRRTIARASARTWRWPTERFAPPPAISLSSVMRESSASSCRLKSPAERSAAFRIASECSEKGSRFCRSVPLSSSGCRHQSHPRDVSRCHANGEERERERGWERD